MNDNAFLSITVAAIAATLIFYIMASLVKDVRRSEVEKAKHQVVIECYKTQAVAVAASQPTLACSPVGR